MYVWERKVDFVNKEKGWLIIWGVGGVFHDVGINTDCVLFSRNNLGDGLGRDVVGQPNDRERINRGGRKGDKLVALGVGLDNVSDVVGGDNGSFSLGDEFHFF